MSLNEILKISINSILSNKVRAFLTMLGIIIGIAAVIALLSLGQGAQSSILQQVEGLGSNTLTIVPVANFSGFTSRSSFEGFVNNKIDYKVLKVLENPVTFSEIEAISPEAGKSMSVSYRSKGGSYTVEGVEETFFDVRGVNINSGRQITKNDNQTLAKVAILGPSVYQKLFGESDPIDKDIKIDGKVFRVIGVAESKGAQLDNNIEVPLNTATSLLLGNKNLSQIVVKVKDENQIDQVSGKIDTEFRKFFKLHQNDEANYSIFSSKDVATLAETVTGIFTTLLSSIASISLIVGGIGIMNIMLVSVTERTKEIGLRKAVGAKQRVILWQFVIEAVVLTVIGGLIGIIFGLSLAFIVGHFGNIPIVISLGSIALATSVSATIGIVFGFYPAYRASRLNPIDALRYE